MRDVNVNRPSKNIIKMRRTISRNRNNNIVRSKVQKYKQQQVQQKEQNGEIIDENDNQQQQKQQTPEQILQSRNAKHNKQKHATSLKNINPDEVKVEQLDKKGRRELKKLKIKQEKKQRKALYKAEKENEIDME
ncbi:hypothetical protein PPERSA_05281 [Pseudocohnilembus persalinus]|uniref:Uncharacterized protein n=1 Tax=Pseudocohnilembus persalinus TaxID=266149 RepID=A0A0V0R5W8_PSEPJ|nr:hypothetical protein PPERSA_05281 [Pseudocohnilembus persalinus]|eukprot:KRX09889.1 hypothetical protein PPERSA_05281 [Pseudocohnilembus persalinus]